MENRERDRMSQRTAPTNAGEVNRGVEQEKGRQSGSDLEFGQNIGQSEHLGEGGTMNRNRNEDVSNKNLGQESESTRRSGSEGGFGSSSGRSSGSSGSMGQGSSIESDKSRRGSVGNTGSSGDSSSGRH